MPRYIVTYDLRKPNYTEKDYENMYIALGFWNAKHIQDSVWAVSSEASATEIFDDLWQHMHQSKDRLLVARAGEFKNIHGITRFKDA